ncbi:MAG TPA: peptidoglycan editing factor PgeF [Clostridiales bacterium UBA8960]|nr:peptidoglycan editing factor PgeF [Clostridiales bacterium UBA8960]
MTVFKHIEIPHGVTNRHGGVSVGPYESMNTSFFGQDDKASVFENIKLALKMLNIDAKTIIATGQVHSDQILYIGDDFQFDSLLKIETPLEGYEVYVAHETDGLMTHRKDVVLMIFYADCVPLIIYDQKKKIAGSIHSGWRGTAQQIGKKAINMMVEKGSDPLDISVGIGHCAGVCCYEVDEPVAEAFASSFSKEACDTFLFPKLDGKVMLDLKIANKCLFLSAGVTSERIDISQDCTICQPDSYFSHRRMGYPRGSMSAFVQIK